MAGIDQLSFYVPSYALPLRLMEKQRQLPSGRFFQDLGQHQMAVPPPCEDIITMGVSAAARFDPNDLEKVGFVLFATETSVDQSKAAGIYIHHFLNLKPNVRVLEVKQACYSATGALQLALDFVKNHPDQKVLVIASDIAKYEIGSLGEPTQGAGAVAMLISNDPRLLTIHPTSGIYTDHVMDFWRPNYLDYAVVSNQYSVKKYMEVLDLCFQDFKKKTNININDLHYFCYHTPFSRMAERVHQRFLKNKQEKTTPTIEFSLAYNRLVGNAYTASLYISLCSLLENSPIKEGEKIGLFSYGSGCVAEYFYAQVQPDFSKHLYQKQHSHMLKEMISIDIETYLNFYQTQIPSHSGSLLLDHHFKTGSLTFLGFDRHSRIYSQPH